MRTPHRGGDVLVCLSVLALFAAAPAPAHPQTAITAAYAPAGAAAAGSAASAVSSVPRAVLGPSVTAPASVSLGSAKPGQTLSVSLGSVTVPNITTRTWVAAVSATPLRTGAGTAAQTIPADRLSYWSGPVVTKSGIGSWTPGQPTAAEAQTLGSSRTAFSFSGLSTSSSVTFRPTLVVSVPTTAVAGNYTGTVTHSVA